MIQRDASHVTNLPRLLTSAHVQYRCSPTTSGTRLEKVKPAIHLFNYFSSILQANWKGEDEPRPPEPPLGSELSEFFAFCLTKISLFNIQVGLQIAFFYECPSLWLWPFNTFIVAKNSFANETQRRAALPHRETGCLPIVRAAWERRGSSAQPGPAHLIRLKADPV